MPVSSIPVKYKTKAAAKIIGSTEQTMTWWRSIGRGPAYVRVGHRVYYLEDDLLAYLEVSRCVPVQHNKAPSIA